MYSLLLDINRPLKPYILYLVCDIFHMYDFVIQLYRSISHQI